MKNTRIVYMGTPLFSKCILEELIKEGYNIIALVSQPDRPIGRKKVIMPTPTKEVALKHNIPVYQVEKIKDENEFLMELKPDLIITCAYGQFVPQKVLDLPRLGCINIHASLLPKLRGGAPIQRAIMEGYSKTGITLMEMTKGMDAGRMYAKIETPIYDEDNYDSLHDRLIELAKKLIIENLDLYIEGKLKGEPQDENEVTIGYNIAPSEEKLDFNKSSKEVFNHIRGLSSNPGAYFIYEGEKVKVYKAKMMSRSEGEIGQIVAINKDSIEIKTLDGSIGLLDIKLQGKNRVEVKSYLNGNNKFKIGRFVE